MPRKLRGFTGAVTVAAMSAGLVLATPGEVASGQTECIGVANQNNYDAEKGEGNLAKDRLAGMIVGYVAERCGNEEPGETVTMQRLGYGTIKLALTRDVRGKGGYSQSGTYSISATTVLTPEGLLSPSAATEMSVSALATMPGSTEPQVAYRMNGVYDFGEWHTDVESHSEYGLFAAVDVQDPDAAHVCGAATAIMADAGHGNPVAYGH